MLKRHVSTIDETSMTNILVRNLSLLINKMNLGIQQLSEATPISMEDYLSYLCSKNNIQNAAVGA